MTKADVVKIIYKCDPSQQQVKALVKEFGAYDVEEPNGFMLLLVRELTGITVQDD